MKLLLSPALYNIPISLNTFTTDLFFLRVSLGFYQAVKKLLLTV
ncbi:MAG: hypothetical protein WBN53_14875 [Thermodesulfobacteriota bacterium]